MVVCQLQTSSAWRLKQNRQYILDEHSNIVPDSNGGIEYLGLARAQAKFFDCTAMKEPFQQDYNAVASHDIDPNDGEAHFKPNLPAEEQTSSRLLRRSEQRDGITYVGRLAIGPGIVGYGSSGTLVFEGSLDGRQVAVKRVLRQVPPPPLCCSRRIYDYTLKLPFVWASSHLCGSWCKWLSSLWRGATSWRPMMGQQELLSWTTQMVKDASSCRKLDPKFRVCSMFFNRAVLWPSAQGNCSLDCRWRAPQYCSLLCHGRRHRICILGIGAV